VDLLRGQRELLRCLVVYVSDFNVDSLMWRVIGIGTPWSLQGVKVEKG